MNALVNYSDDDSDSEQEQPKAASLTKGTSPARVGDQQGENGEDKDEDDILAKLKELQDFAALVSSDDDNESVLPPPPPPPPPLTDDKDDSTQGSASKAPQDMKEGSEVDQEEEDRVFALFMEEVNAIPTTTLIQTEPPPPPPTPPQSTLDEIPPPPPVDTTDLHSKRWTTVHPPGVETPQAVYSRLHSLSLLPGTAVDQKDTERRLIEFAIRILDWEEGGLRPGYFLGEERARKLEELAQESDQSLQTKELPDLPPFGGVVGAVLNHIHELEILAAPEGWQALWDANDEAYGFQHWRTGTLSPVYPSAELIQALDPITPSARIPSAAPRKHGFKKSNLAMTKQPFAEPTIASLEMPTSPMTTLAKVGATTPSPVTADSPSSTTSTPPLPPPQPQPQPLPSSETVIKKKAKRKAGESVGDEDTIPADAHIHPSRRAVLASASGVGASSSSTASSSNAPSRMPKKVASLLQKWSEKNMDDSEASSEDEEFSEAAPSGANSEYLGSDWRERRLYRKL